MAKKPEGPIGWTQTPAQGDQPDGFHSQDPIAEAAAHGDTPAKVVRPNDNQGGK